MPELVEFAQTTTSASQSEVSLVSATLWLWLWIFLSVANFIVSIPTFLVSALSTNYKITLSLSLILAAGTVLGAVCVFVLRYKVLTGYLKVTQPKDSAKHDLLVQDIKEPRHSKQNYLDEFLSAIKVFGYLEKPVFHELTKNMTTQKLAPGEVLYLDEKLGFSIVVEGTVQVYTKIESGDDSGPEIPADADSIEDNEDVYDENSDADSCETLVVGKQRYQLLNEVKSGAPLSSLMSTLDFFAPVFSRTGSVHSLELKGFHIPESADSSQSPEDISTQPQYPDIVARPKPQNNSSDSVTIAIIPASAFQRVQTKYPKATSHIVTMVLTRLYKVTMNTIHNYLGLTREILDSEIQLNSDTSSTQLPSYLHEGLVQRFYGDEKEDPRPSLVKHHHSRLVSHQSSRYVVLDSRLKSSHPGDLLSSVPLLRRPDIVTSSRVPKIDDINRGFSDDHEETEETSLRTAVVENIFKLIGIDENLHLHSTFSSSSSLTGLSSMDSMGILSERRASIHNTVFMSQRKYLVERSKDDYDFDTVKNHFSKLLDIKFVPPNTTIVKQDSFHSGLYYVIDGTLDVVSEKTGRRRKLYSVREGGLAGYLSSIVGYRSLVSIKTQKKGAIVAHITKNNFSTLMDKFFFLQLPVAFKLKSLLSKQMLMIDYALEWCHVPAGNILFAQGDAANGFHIVLSGRFRVVKRKSEDTTTQRVGESYEKDKKDKDDYTVLGEYGHGESIGEVEVLTASRRKNTLIAVRDSETARIPRTLFEMLSLKNPSIMVKVSRTVASRLVELEQLASSVPIATSVSSLAANNDYKTITILPSVHGLPVREFADKLVQAMKTIGRNVIALDQASTLTHLGRHAFDERLAQLKLSGYFAYLEEEYQTIVYVCDTPVKSNWTSTCISQGDCILLLADAEDDDVAINAGDYEKLLLKMKTTARTDLCLIHPDRYVVPGSTSIWKKNRIWVQGHHHIQMELGRGTSSAKRKPNIIRDLAEKISSKTNPNIKHHFDVAKSKAVASLVKLNTRINTRLNRLDQQLPAPPKDDFLRLARILSNEAVGLVLGGGGSRGISHVGVVMALEKHGIPVDLIGGTSIGSFVGGLYAMEYNIVSIYGRAKKFAKRVSSLWRSLFDLTYPVTSYITGYEFNRGIWKLFGYNEIEDFWIRYFCNSTNITNSTMDIHETGYAWRFIRASMSLAGLLPPITFKGCMLLDGGYLDNLPVMEMKRKGAKYIIAVDVGSVDDRTPMDYGDTLSGFWVLFNRWNPFSTHPNVPNMMDIQMRLAYVASVNALEIAKKTPGVIYLRPPIDDYATLDFAKFDEIHNVGLAYADALFTKLESNGSMPPIAGMVDKKKINRDENRSLYRRNSM